MVRHRRSPRIPSEVADDVRTAVIRMEGCSRSRDKRRLSAGGPMQGRRSYQLILESQLLSQAGGKFIPTLFSFLETEIIDRRDRILNIPKAPLIMQERFR